MLVPYMVAMSVLILLQTIAWIILLAYVVSSNVCNVT